ncbi:MAG TPA: gluconate:H+ symporter [Longimicrobiales bacterium]|nr:gluconate:H+ symporter [Longimicrobiales bacterium]
MTTGPLIGLVVLGVALILFLIIVLRIQAFAALLLASMVVAVVGGVPLAEIGGVIQEGMGRTLGYLAIVVGLGAMLGALLEVSGGAERIARTLVGRVGEARAPWALALTGLIVATPVFFDVALILFIPLVYSLARQSGRSLLFYAIPLVAGIAVGHSFIPPTPGPVAVASLLGADLGWVIALGLLAGVPATIIGGVFFGRHMAGRIHLGVPEYMLQDADSRAAADDAELPGFGLVLALIGVPLLLILLSTVSRVVLAEGHPLRALFAFIGHPFTALLLAALLAFYLLGVRRGYSADEVRKVATAGLEPVGLIILVTGAGGVFGNVLVETGVGRALADLMAGSNMPVVVLAFLIATVVRVAQGSATVAMVTAAGIIAPVIEAGSYPAPMLGALTIAIASGATVLSHVNDSGFWLVSRFLGMSEAQTLRSWTVMETLVGLVGFAVALVFSFFL